MPRWTAGLALVFVTCLPCAAGEPRGKLVGEAWDAAYLDGNRAGYVHTSTYEIDQGGQKVLRTTVDLTLTVKKFKDVIKLRGVTGNDELPDGTILGTFMRQQVGQNKELTIVGVVKGKQLELMLDGKAGVMKPAPWDDRAVSLFRQQTLLADRKVRPGDKFSYLSFEPSVNLLVRMDVVVRDYEPVELPGNKNKVKLLRVETVPERLEGVKLPVLVQWLDDNLQPVRQDTDAPGLGQLTLIRTTRELATAPGAEATLTDIGISQLLRLNRKIANPYDTKAIVYRITLKGDDEAASAFVIDDRQRLIGNKGSTIEIQVLGGKTLGKAGAPKPGDEFLQSSYFITADDPKVKELARKAVGKEKDLLKKALAIEKWVNANMKGTSYEALAPASEVARNLEGDCTEFAMLMAAMCRAEGVPSRTAIGLIYADTKSGPVMSFHMWTEVWVGDQWIGMDATLGKGRVSPAHLKITDHSWSDTRSLTPLLPLIRVLGKMQIEVVSVQ
jgi:hypothetical protein